MQQQPQAAHLEQARAKVVVPDACFSRRQVIVRVVPTGASLNQVSFQLLQPPHRLDAHRAQEVDEFRIVCGAEGRATLRAVPCALCSQVQVELCLVCEAGQLI